MLRSQRQRHAAWFSMTKKERASIIRIVQDIIRADGIIDMREMASLDALRMKYGIERLHNVVMESIYEETWEVC